MDQFQSGFCSSCGKWDPVFGAHRISGEICHDPNHEPYQKGSGHAERYVPGVVSDAVN
jgi:hypothetical protein